MPWGAIRPQWVKEKDIDIIYVQPWQKPVPTEQKSSLIDQSQYHVQ